MKKNFLIMSFSIVLSLLFTYLAVFSKNTVPVGEHIPTSTFFHFADLSVWDVSNDGMKEVDTRHTFKSECAIRVTGKSSGMNPYISRDIYIEAMNTIDLWMWCDRITDLHSITLYLSTDDFTSYLSENIHYTLLQDGWNHLRFHKSDFTQEQGSASANAITQIRIRLNSAPGRIASATFDSIVVNAPDRKYMVLSFDDGFDSVYDIAYPMAKEKGSVITAYVNRYNIGKPGYMKEEQLVRLYGEGFDISNHSDRHEVLTSMSTEQVYQDLLNNQNYLLGLGFERSARHIAYPTGSTNDSIINMCRKIKANSGRTVKNSAVFMPIDNIFRLPTILTLDNRTTEADVEKAIDNAIEKLAGMMIYGHKIADEPGEDVLAVKTKVLEKVFDYCLEKNIEMLTISQWYEQIYLAGEASPKVESQ